MATNASENFDSYTNGTNLSGQNGGSGWSTAWTLGGGVPANSWVISNTQSLSAPNSVQMILANATSGNGIITRDFTPITGTGSCAFSIWITPQFATGSADILFILQSAGGATSVNITIFGSGAAGNPGPGMVFRLSGATNIILASNVTASTWHNVVINFDCGAGTATATFDAGAPTSSVGFTSGAGNFQEVEMLNVNTQGGGLDAFFDNITVASAAAAFAVGNRPIFTRGRL